MSSRFPNRSLIVCGLLLWYGAPHLVAAFPEKGDRVDITLLDGRTFQNAAVVKAEAEAYLIWSNGTLTSFKAQDVRSLTRSGSSAPTPPEEMRERQEKPPEQPKAADSVPEQSRSPSPAVAAPPILKPEAIVRADPEKPKETQIIPLALIVLSAAFIALIFYAARQRENTKKLRELEIKYRNVIDVEKVVAERKKEADDIGREIRQRTADREELKLAIEGLRKQIELFEGEQDIVACGHYKPLYDFNTSDEFKKAIDEIRDQQRQSIKDEQAAFCSEKWTVNGSEVEGRKATKRTLRLMLRAFNGESDAIIARVSWNNIDRMLERLQAVFDAINKLGESYRCHLNRDYLHLKRKELQLTFEYENKLKQEKDEQRELKERMRDEERARREMEDAIKQTALDEERAQKALAQARAELGTASAEKESALNERILALEGRLQEALKNKERALSRAQQTRSGHVYIISNIGSFGETVFKIGMTRRLDPHDRVHELGDASVPFSFDVHAMIYTDDAPALEAKLHQRFDRHRVNLINERKEFFYTTTDELETIAKELGVMFSLTKLAEAREYRETVERRKAITAALEKISSQLEQGERQNTDTAP